MPQIKSIQAMRAVAALAVVFGHLQREATSLPSATGFQPVLLDLTGVGVDLFFVISGFVMVYASRDLFMKHGATHSFLTRRVARIVPLYWGVTTLFLLMLATSHVMSSAPPTWQEIIKSYLFIPYVPIEGGAMQPAFKLGWTLEYEMFFYTTFAATLVLPMRVAVLAITCLFVGLVALGYAASPAPGVFAFWSDPIILEFIFGAIVTVLYESKLRLRAWVSVAMVLVGVLGLGLTVASTINAHGPLRPIVWGLPMTLIFAGVVLASTRPVSSRLSIVAIALGDGSYAMYLLHPLIIRSLRVAFDKTHVGVALSPWIFVAAGLVLVVPFSLIVHHWLERPVTRRLSKLLSPGHGRAREARAPTPGIVAS